MKKGEKWHEDHNTGSLTTLTLLAYEQTESSQSRSNTPEPADPCCSGSAALEGTDDPGMPIHETREGKVQQQQEHQEDKHNTQVCNM